MAVYSNPKGIKEDLFAPFGPGLGRMRLSPAFVRAMNSVIDERLSPLVDYSHNLVGKVSQELMFNEDMRDMFLDEVGGFVTRYVQWSIGRTSFGTATVDPKEYGPMYRDGWIVRQYEGEYNPVHIHPGCKLSCVGYLRLPPGMDEAYKEEYKDNQPSNGHIQFVHGSPSSWASATFLAKPQVGDFYLFPSDLFHTVYPFYTKGERRSFSVNMDYAKLPPLTTDA